MRKIIHLSHLVIINLMYSILRIWIFYLSLKPKKNHSNKKIALLPYTPLGWYGGDIRIANWKPYIENEGYNVDIVWCWNTKEMWKFDNQGWYSKYWVYTKICWRRFKFFFKIHKFNFVLVQRAYMPIYPFKKAMFEKLLTKTGIQWMVDFYDPDYRNNPEFVNQTAKYATKVSVVNNYLKDYFQTIGCLNIEIINLTLDESKYLIKDNYSNNDKLIIGWMGSKSNYTELLKIKDVLIRIQEKYSMVKYHIVCKDVESIEGLNMEITPWSEDSFYKILSDFDIGIVPISYLENEWLKGKVAMKSVEMMATGVPIVCSSFGVSNALVDGKNALLADSDEQWYEKISILLNDEVLRKKIGEAAQKSFMKFHTYESQFEKLKTALTTKNNE